MILPPAVYEQFQLVGLEQGEDWSHPNKVQRGLKFSDLLQGERLLVLRGELVYLGILLA